jgi:hypothetical protein
MVKIVGLPSSDYDGQTGLALSYDNSRATPRYLVQLNTGGREKDFNQGEKPSGRGNRSIERRRTKWRTEQR